MKYSPLYPLHPPILTPFFALGVPTKACMKPSESACPLPILSSKPVLRKNRRNTVIQNRRLIVTPFGRFCSYRGILQKLRLFIIFLALKMQFVCPMSNARSAWEPIQLWPISLGQVLARTALQLVSLTCYYSASILWHHNMDPAMWFKSFLYLI